jgi:glycogen phosphorylase
MEQERGVVVYITPEIAIDPKIPSYSGGLGYLAGSAAMSAKKLGIPMVVFSIPYRKGYYTQKCDQNGMIVDEVDYNYEGLIEKTGIKFQISLCGALVWIELLKVPGERYNSVDIYYLTTDIEENDLLSKSNCLQLYTGNQDRRIAQAIILGRGTVEACKRLNISVHCWHVNESHGVLAQVELAQLQGVDQLRSKTVFTTHTQVASGNPSYKIEDLHRMSGFNVENLKNWGGDPFNMAAAGIRLSRKSNAVSRKHLDVCKKMWHWVLNSNGHDNFDERFTYITNGVDQDYWQYPEFRDSKCINDLKVAKMLYKRKLIDYIRKQPIVGRYFSENIPIVVWARRFAGYKRPKLMFDYLHDWLYDHLRNNRMQLVFSGKPHPDDKEMVDSWNFILNKSQNWPNIVILPGYELELSKILKGGADIWLNTPRSHFEACGTSGMSANLNGAIHISTPDGWAYESDPNNCLLFGSAELMRDYEQNKIDSACLREVMDTALVMDNQTRFGMAMSAKIEAEKRWTSDRMMREYAKLYDIEI